MIKYKKELLNALKFSLSICVGTMLGLVVIPYFCWGQTGRLWGSLAGTAIAFTGIFAIRMAVIIYRSKPAK
ncbi:hypothetical protein [Desulfoscipio gibsoniae]|uniref:hypothetical protein n=1 Tax=Desulfoscipio gibsoniae TaxID=102134 RepID=UPI0012FEDD25|nr:hypothetical protein [Desulfoscipio gibsoniae]